MNKINSNLFYGSNYDATSFEASTEAYGLWICPVTLFVLGRYPKYIYVKAAC